MKKSRKTKSKAAPGPRPAGGDSRAALEPRSKLARTTAAANRKEAKRRTRAGTGVSVKERSLGLVEKSTQFLREVRVELSKVTWPTRKDTIASTSVVLVIVILIAVFLGIVDLGLSRILRMVLS